MVLGVKLQSPIFMRLFKQYKFNASANESLTRGNIENNFSTLEIIKSLGRLKNVENAGIFTTKLNDRIMLRTTNSEYVSRSSQ